MTMLSACGAIGHPRAALRTRSERRDAAALAHRHAMRARVMGATLGEVSGARERIACAVALASLVATACGGDASLDGGVDDATTTGSGLDAPSDAGLDASSEGEDAGRDAVADDAFVPFDPWLEDVTERWGVAFDRDGRDGYETLLDRTGGGVCPIDADGVAPLDLFFAMRPTARVRSRLYVASQPGGAGTEVTYVDETDARGLAEVGDALACLAFDADADGDADLLVSGVGTVRLFENREGAFVDVSDRLGLALDARDMYVSAAAGDVDDDGDVDVLVAGFLRFDDARFAPGQRCGAIPCRSALYEFEGIPNLLLVREADGTYRERGAAIAPDLRRDETTFVVGILRMTGRGPVDLWIGNDLGARHRDRVLRRRAGGTFEDVAVALGLATNGRGYGIDTMGWSQGDLDGDGELDFVQSSWPGDTTAAHFCAPIAGEDLCEERGRAVGLALSVGSFRWGEALVDLDLDGDLDLIEATGHLYAQEDLGTREEELQRPNLFENEGGVLRLLAPTPGEALDFRGTMRGLAVADLDDDGRPDVVMAPARGAPRILRNVRAPRGRWLRVALAGRSAGARVEITHARGTIVRVHAIGEGFLGNFDPRVLVGVPEGADSVDVRVTWPTGVASERTDVALDREIVIPEH